MAPPPGDPDHHQQPNNGDSQRTLPTPFLSKTYNIVDDTSVDDIVSWNEDGSGFIVWNPTEFARDLLPKYFKHNNFSSFVRQLNTYGFRKIVPDRWEFSNDFFKRGEKHLLCGILRRKVTPPAAVSAALTPNPMSTAVTIALQPISPLIVSGSPSDSNEEHVISSSSCPMPTSPIATHPVPIARDHSFSSIELLDENERLRKENLELDKELAQMKSLCSNIYSFMSTFAKQEDETTRLTPLDLLSGRCFDGQDRIAVPDGENSEGTRLFGFPIGKKRLRECESGSEDNYHELQLRLGGMDMKSEPSDQEGSDDQESMWLG